MSRWALACCTVAVLAAGAVVGQGEPTLRGEGFIGQFAWPWNISFAHIQSAMEKRTYETRQVRRVLDRSDPRQPAASWISVQERLRHFAAGAGRPSNFVLEFEGVVGRELTQAEFDQRSRRYGQIAGFLFHHQSFSVSDAAAASRNYAIHFLGFARRAGRPVYQTAIVPRVGDRPSWSVDLDIVTGYPLYRAEFDANLVKVAEVEVFRFNPNFRGGGVDLPVRNRTSHPSPYAALGSIGLGNAQVPEAAVLPSGFELRSSRVLAHPLTNVSKAVLTYSDGIDKLFLVVGESGESITKGNVILIYQDDAGMAQCRFDEDGVRYILAGRETNESLRQLAKTFYAQIGTPPISPKLPR